MKKNLYYQHTLSRYSFKEALVNLFLGLSWPRMILEVFLRKNFGDRYFYLSTAIVVAVFLGLMPAYVKFILAFFQRRYEEFDVWAFLFHYTTWYLFIAAFLYASFARHKEKRWLPSVFDFERYSRSSGEINPIFFQLRLAGKPADIRTVETLLEPSGFFIVSLLLILLGQRLGFLLLGCSVFYSLSYRAAYRFGDNFVMDHIDEMICNEELVAAFVDDVDSRQTRGFRFYGRRPADPDVRRKVAETFWEDEEDAVKAR